MKTEGKNLLYILDFRRVINLSAESNSLRVLPGLLKCSKTKHVYSTFLGAFVRF